MADGENVRALIAIFTGGFQDLADAARATIVGRTVDEAIGAQEDVLGKIVGQRRDGLDDEPFRRRLRAKIAANRASGLTEQVIRITRLVLGASYDAPASSVIVDRKGNAQYALRVDGASVDDATADDVARFLLLADASATRVTIETSEEEPDTWARFDESKFDDDKTMISARDRVQGA